MKSTFILGSGLASRIVGADAAACMNVCVCVLCVCVGFETHRHVAVSASDTVGYS